MPDAKLTLRLDADAIARAKRVAQARGTSVSTLVEGYFAALDSGPSASRSSGDRDSTEERTPLPPMTAWFASPPPARTVPDDAYDRYRDEKYG